MKKELKVESKRVIVYPEFDNVSMNYGLSEVNFPVNLKNLSGNVIILNSNNETSYKKFNEINFGDIEIRYYVVPYNTNVKSLQALVDGWLSVVNSDGLNIEEQIERYDYCFLDCWGEYTMDESEKIFNDIINDEMFPLNYNGKLYNEKDCDEMFLSYYHCVEALHHNCGVYVTDGVFVYPDGKLVDES